MAAILMLIGVLQGYTVIGFGIILLVLVKKLRDKPQSTKIMSPNLQGHHNRMYITIRKFP